MPKYGFLVVEGPHDVEFAYRLLSPFGFKRIQFEADLDPFLEPLISRKYPPDGDLQKRMDTPLFLGSQTHIVALRSANGDSRLIGTVEENMSLCDAGAFAGIGLLLDSDKLVPAAERYATVKAGLAAKGFSLPDLPGAIAPGAPRLGAYVLPDNQTPGTLEDLLIESAQAAYPNLLQRATSYVDASSEDDTLEADDLADFRKPAGRNKAIVGAIASVLRPGKAVQVSIQDNRWLRGGTLTIPRIKAVQDFLAALLELA